MGNQAVYERLTKTAAKNHLSRLDYLLRVFVSKHRPLHLNEDPSTAITSKELTKSDEIYFLRALKLKSAGQFTRFRMTIKVHKNPPKMRPIVCCAGTRLNYLSKWLDYQLQRLKPFIPSYIRDSHELLAKMKTLGRLPPGAKVFTADANSMYTNIDTEHAIRVISAWLDSLSDQLPLDFPVNAVKEAMKIVMRNNIFEWGDIYFRQLLGTAMGTSAACMWATAYYGVHESNNLLPAYSAHLILYVRFIDDIFGIWNGTDKAWQAFKRDINDFGILTWEICEPSSLADFLDLTISIEQDGSLTTKTYQKAMNLYQYIPPQSAHTPGMTKGVIYSLMKNYHLQNSKQSDYLKMATLLLRRYVARGWELKTIKSLILDADEKIRLCQHSDSSTGEAALTTKERVFLHMEYHPNDIPRKLIRTIYNQNCGELFEEKLGIKQTTIAYSRAKNLRELLTQAKLHQAPGHEASKYFTGELTDT